MWTDELCWLSWVGCALLEIKMFSALRKINIQPPFVPQATHYSAARLYTYVGPLLKMTQKRTQLCAKLAMSRMRQITIPFMMCFIRAVFAENWSKIAFTAYSKPKPTEINFPTAAGMVYIKATGPLCTDQPRRLYRRSEGGFLHWSQCGVTINSQHAPQTAMARWVV